MNRVRVIGLGLIVALAAWFALRSCTPEAPAPAPPPPPAREAFHVSKPLRVEVRQAAADGSVSATTGWLERETRFLLARGKMKVATIDAASASDASPASSASWLLRLILNDASTDARLALIAPDDIEERSETIQLVKDSRLTTIRSIAERLPKFLAAPSGTGDWAMALGTNDAATYDIFIEASDALLNANAHGFTAPPAPAQEAVLNLERIEKLARRQRDFVRARALLSLAYLSVGGDDQASLAKLAETAAERALAADPQLAEPHAALGIVRLRRMDWAAAQEHFAAALAMDPNSPAALEGLGCLLMDVGHTKQALPVAARIARLQPGNRGGRECATYAAIAQQSSIATVAGQPFDVARIHAAMLLLAGDHVGADALLKTSLKDSNELIDTVVGATSAPARVPEALRIITRSADDEAIDAETEMLFGTALRRPDFVFNRMLRLAKQSEAVPLRLLWLPQTDFLRKHRRFKDVVSAASLTTYWQDHGVPDVCTAEPKVHGCAVSSSKK